MFPLAEHEESDSLTPICRNFQVSSGRISPVRIVNNAIWIWKEKKKEKETKYVFSFLCKWNWEEKESVMFLKSHSSWGCKAEGGRNILDISLVLLFTIYDEFTTNVNAAEKDLDLHFLFHIKGKEETNRGWERRKLWI